MASKKNSKNVIFMNLFSKLSAMEICMPTSINRYILSCSSLLLGYFQITTVFYVQIRLNIEKNPIKKWKQDRNFFLLFFSLLLIPNQTGSIEKVKGIRIIPYFSRSSTSYFSGSSDSVILKFLLYLLIERNVTRHFGFDGRSFECNYLSMLCFFL